MTTRHARRQTAALAAKLGVTCSPCLSGHPLRAELLALDANLAKNMNRVKNTVTRLHLEDVRAGIRRPPDPSRLEPTRSAAAATSNPA
jgi:hypothetical protein